MEKFSIKTKYSGNAGFTLIEVIISMLILSIVTIPILQSFSVSMRTNLKSADRGAAEEYAQSLMETVQSYGLKKIEEQFKSNHFNLGILSMDGFAEVTNEKFSHKVISDRQEGKCRYYRIIGGMEGNRKYDVQISYDPTVYAKADSKTAYNINQLPDLSAFSKDNSAVIDPAGSYIDFLSESEGYMYDVTSGSYLGYRNGSYEDIAKDNFFAMYRTCIQEICATTNEYLAESDTLIKASDLIKPEDLIAGDPNVVKENFSKGIKRTTGIKVTPSGKGYKVTAMLEYSLVKDSPFVTSLKKVQGLVRNHCTGIRGNNFPDLASLISDIWNNHMSREALHQSYIIYNSKSPINDLKSIYLMYDPLKRSQWGEDTIVVDLSDVTSSFGAGKRLNLFVVPQKGLIAMENGSEYKMQSTDYIAPGLTSGTLHLNDAGEYIDVGGYIGNMINLHYEKGFFLESGAFAASNAKNNLVAESKNSQDLIYAIKIKVYKHEKSEKKRFNNSDLLAELSYSGY